jgi:hypothetical protein
MLIGRLLLDDLEAASNEWSASMPAPSLLLLANSAVRPPTTLRKSREKLTVPIEVSNSLIVV